MRQREELPTPVRFLHAVGQSTLRQGLTVPVIAQVMWLAEIKKGESVPVTVLFGSGKSATASLRRLNNARGHLQFRYESREQAALRDHLVEVFGEVPDRRTAVLEVLEVKPRVFSFQPVSGARQQQAFLSLYKPHFHKLTEIDALQTPEYNELAKCLAATPYDARCTQREYNNLISERLIGAGWRKEARVAKHFGLRCDFEKNGLWLEVEFGNARVYYQDYIKFLVALRYEQARFGVLLCPTNAFAQLLCDLGQRRAAGRKTGKSGSPPSYSGMMSYEKAMRELPLLDFILVGPIVVAGIDIRGLRTESKPRI